MNDQAIINRLDTIVELLRQMNERDQWFKDRSVDADTNAREEGEKLVDDVITRVREQFEQDRIEKARAAAGGVKAQ